MTTQVSAVPHQAERQVPPPRELLSLLSQHSGQHPHRPRHLRQPCHHDLHHHDSDYPQEPHDSDPDTTCDVR